MITRTEKIDDRVVKAVNDVLRERMGRFGFKQARVRVGPDWTGEPILFIDAEYDLLPTPLEAGATYGIAVDLMDALEAVGETRFPHVKHHFHELQTTTRDR